MSEKSNIQWTDATWNPVTGCTKVSPGCKNCYAERLAERLQASGSRRYRNGFALTLHEDVLDLPLHWKKPRMVFVNSMSDLFHEDIPEDFIRRAFHVMAKASWHTFQILTKRAVRLASLASQLHWPRNVWIGVSVENNRYAGERISYLLDVPAEVRFLSCEPLLDTLDLSRWLAIPGAIHWVIVGGESGPGHRFIDPVWVTDLRDQCVQYGIPFFFKQWGGVTPKSGGRLLDGREWDEMPRHG